MNPSPLPVAVIGAGPVGLAAAAQLSERGIPYVVFEVGDLSLHQVREVTSGLRISLSGWFYP